MSHRGSWVARDSNTRKGMRGYFSNILGYARRATGIATAALCLAGAQYEARAQNLPTDFSASESPTTLEDRIIEYRVEDEGRFLEKIGMGAELVASLASVTGLMANYTDINTELTDMWDDGEKWCAPKTGCNFLSHAGIIFNASRATSVVTGMDPELTRYPLTLFYIGRETLDILDDSKMPLSDTLMDFASIAAGFWLSGQNWNIPDEKTLNFSLRNYNGKVLGQAWLQFRF